MTPTPILAGEWQPVTPEMPSRLDNARILLATERSVLGLLSGRKGDDWFIDGSYYDGDDPPVWWMRLPPLPGVSQ